MIATIMKASQLLAIILTRYFPIDGFNLETRLPVVKYGNNGSYFGYAVAAHQYRVDSKNVGLMLVGAPLDQNLQPNTHRSGALWSCPMTNNARDCVQVITDGRRDPVKTEFYNKTKVDSNDLFPPGRDENKTDQWLGVTVKSQGPDGKVLVCAHRYKQIKLFDKVSSDNFTVYGLGLCYVLRPDLEFLSVLNHCYGKERDRGHVNYGFCQIGTSGMIFEDDSAIIGAPGPKTWRGAVFMSSVSEDLLERDNNVYEGIDKQVNDNDQVESEPPEVHIRKFAYMGMSVTAGYFLGDKTTVYVAGAPRNNQTGEVILFTKPIHTTHPAQNSRLLRERLIIKGEQIASNFGYEVIGADVNGDKLPDLIVAAPFYFTNEAGGAVYIYMNDPVHHLKDAVRIRLTGKPESRFGFALTSLGDINKDGYEDIAIGAPYEDRGVVYVYLGSRDGLITKPSQVIRAEKDGLSTIPLRTFGYSLSGGIDLDENGYPDLVVGAYESDSVVLLRSRPIIGIRTFVRSPTNLTNFDPNARNCLINNTNYAPCFEFQTCCTIDSIVKNKNHSVEIEYELQAETFNNQRETSRIWFDDFGKKSNIVAKNRTVHSDSTNRNAEFCYNHVAYLKENTLDIQSPILMRLSYKLVNKDPVTRPATRHLLSLDNYPILNQQEAFKVFSASFLKDCGNNDLCESELIVSTSLSLKKTANQENEYDLVLGEHEKLLMNVNVTNMNESAYQTQLFVKLADLTSYSKSTDLISMKEDVCSAFENGTFVVCRLGNPMKQYEQWALQLEIDLQKVDENTPQLSFKVNVNTTSEDRNKDNSHFLHVNVLDKVMLHISGDSSPEKVPDLVNGEVIAESNMKYKEEVGPRVIHSYTVVNNGSWHQTDIDLDIDWPYQVTNDKVQGKWLMYLDEAPEVEVSGNNRAYCKSQPYINPLNLADQSKNDTRTSSANDKNTSSGKLYNRLTRDVDYVVRAETFEDDKGNTRKVVNMNCGLGSAKCHKILCRIEYIERKQFIAIKMKSRLYEPTFVEDYADVDEINVVSKAKIHIPETTVRVKNAYPNEVSVTTKARVTLHGQQPAAPIPLFIIIVAIIIGLLLFMLLTLVLWKLGFFKRRRPDPTLSGNLEKHRIEEYHDY